MIQLTNGTSEITMMSTGERREQVSTDQLILGQLAEITLVQVTEERDDEFN